MTLTQKNSQPPLLLMILDGWGYREETGGNAVAGAKKPNLDRLVKKYPTTLCEASGVAVGLPAGQMGNSEVGHLNIGSGRVVYQDLTLISKEIKEGVFFKNPVLLKAMNAAKNRALHLMGLVSYGGVHSHMDHLKALLIMAKQEGIEKVYVHAFLDGRDVVPKSAMNDLTELQIFMKTEKVGQMASIMGRFYAMDRDKRWERTQIAYDALTSDAENDNIVKTANWKDALKASFDKNETDEFVKPIILLDPSHKRMAQINDGDSVIFFNFRPDRARQLTYSFIAPDKIGFSRKAKPKVNFVCMTQYDEELEIPIAYPPKELKNTLGEYLSKLGKKQFRIAETEKYAHVTFFFNGGVEEPNAGEDRLLIPSPKVNTYDLKPEMSAYEVTDALLQKIDENKYDFIVLNFANMDMVGHTGIYSAAVAAVEAVDDCVGKIVDKMLEKNGTVMIMADHGNAEKMLEDDGRVCTSHTTNPVTLVYVSNKKQIQLKDGSKLCDIAPTILETMDIEIPQEMTGTSLLIQE